MSKAQAHSESSAAQRILEVASELFYQNGYHATGINEVIAKAGVAKATFYSHFPSKEDLAREYIEETGKAEVRHIDGFIARAKDPMEKYLAVIASLEPWLLETDFRGCPFINLASETPDPDSPLREAGKMVYSEARNRVTEACQELIASDSKRYGHLDPEQLTRNYMLIFVGAIGLAEIYHAMWPLEHALEGARGLIR